MARTTNAALVERITALEARIAQLEAQRTPLNAPRATNDVPRAKYTVRIARNDAGDWDVFKNYERVSTHDGFRAANEAAKQLSLELRNA